MTQFSDYAEEAILNWMFTAGAVTRPSAWYLALFTASPSDSGGGTEVGAGVNYSRQAITFGSVSSPGGTISNSAAITFGPASNAGFGTVTHVGVFDASTSGNLLMYGALTSSQTVAAGNSLQFGVGQLTLTVA